MNSTTALCLLGTSLPSREGGEEAFLRLLAALWVERGLILQGPGIYKVVN